MGPSVSFLQTTMLLSWRCVLRCHWHRLRGIIVCTSARFTALAIARLSSSGVIFSAPGSSLNRARMAEASSTTLFVHGCPASFRNQFVGEQPPRFDELSQTLPGLCQPALECRDANLVVLNAQLYFVSDRQTKGRAERCRNNDAALSLDANAVSQLCVGHLPSSATRITK